MNSVTMVEEKTRLQNSSEVYELVEDDSALRCPANIPRHIPGSGGLAYTTTLFLSDVV